MIRSLFDLELNAELVATLLFIILSGLYIITQYGIGKLLDAMFLWMFPASIMIFLTLMIVKVIEKFHNRTVSRYRYIDWRNR
jgi:hypothetical protein